MLLTRLKNWRELRGYTVRSLAEKSGIGFTTVSFLENCHRPPQGLTARRLADALDVEVADLYEPEPAPVSNAITNDNTRSIATRTRAKKQTPAGNCWVIDHEGDAFGPFVPAEAERLKGKLGQARVYQTASKNDARGMHRQFLIRVARGHDAW